MNLKQFNKILRLVRRTGDKVVMPDGASDKVMVIMDSAEYEFLLDGSMFDSQDNVEGEGCEWEDPFEDESNEGNYITDFSTEGFEDLDIEEESKEALYNNEENLDELDIEDNSEMMPIDEIIREKVAKNEENNAPLYIESASESGFEPVTPEKMPDFGEIDIEEPLDDVVDETELEELEFKPEPIE
mgnify:CR=1 FL=1